MKYKGSSYFIAIVSVLFLSVLTGCQSLSSEGEDYSIIQIDLSRKPDTLDSRYDELFRLTVVDMGDENNTDYLAHPDSVLLEDDKILILYPEGHGSGPVAAKISSDGGETWGSRLTGMPESWKNSMETPTVYRLGDRDDSSDPYRDVLFMISANPSWSGTKGNLYGNGLFNGNGFNWSYSIDNGENWSEFLTEFPYGDPDYVNPIVAMASLTRLKDEKGNWSDRWMGLFHDYDFVNYKTILSFDESGTPHWSSPEPYFKEYRKIEKYYNMCEVEVIRSDENRGDTLLLLGRSNNKRNNSIISVSRDEGKTWSQPVEAPAALNGERHKAEWLPDGRLFITFRSIERSPDKAGLYGARSWFSEGWIGWIGTFDDILSGREGQYRVKIAHTYLKNQTEPELSANADTGYCANVVLKDGTVVTASYGRFGETNKTYIASKRLNIELLDELYTELR